MSVCRYISCHTPFLFIYSSLFPIEIPPPPTNLTTMVTRSGRVLHWIPPNTTAHIRQYRIVGIRDGEIIEQYTTYDSTQALLDSFHHWHNYSVVMYAENTCGSSVPSDELHVAEVNGKPGTVLVSFHDLVRWPGTECIRSIVMMMAVVYLS